MFYEILGNEQVTSTKKAAIAEILAANKASENLIITSVITHLEVLPAKLSEKGSEDERDYLSLFDAKHFHEVELNTNIIMRAREIRDFYYKPPDTNGEGAKMMDLGDAIHLATATVLQVSEMHTRDNKKRKGNIPLLTLYKETGIPRLCDKYDLTIVSPESAQGSLDGI